MPKILTATEMGLGNQRSSRGASLPTPKFSGARSDAPFGGIQARETQQAGQAMLQASDWFAQKQEQEDNSEAVLLSNAAHKDLLQTLYSDNGLMHQYGANGSQATAKFQESFESLKKRYTEQAGNKQVNQALEEQFNNLEMRYLPGVMKHDSRESRKFIAEQAENTGRLELESIALNPNDEEGFNQSLQAVVESARKSAMLGGLSEEGTAKAVRDAKSGAIMARMQGILRRQAEPEDIIRARQMYDAAIEKGDLNMSDAFKLDSMFGSVEPKAEASIAWRYSNTAAGDFDTIADFVIDVLEGGGAIVPDGDGRARFGVNDAANPHVKLENLTKKGAKENVYKPDYWNAIDADNLPRDMRAVAFDTAVNHGVGRAKKLIAKAGNDPQKLLSLRYQEYHRLAKANPAKYGQYLKGWKVRLKKLDDFISRPIKDPETRNAHINSVSEEARPHLSKMYEEHDRIEVQKVQMETKQTLDSVMDIMETTNGNINEIPAELAAQAKEQGLWGKVVSYKGNDDLDTVVEIERMPEDEFKNLNLDEIRFELSANTYKKYVKEQAALRNEEPKAISITERRRIAKEAMGFYGEDLNKEQEWRFKAGLEARVELFEKAEGRTATKAEITEMARLALEQQVKTEAFIGTRDRYIFSEEAFEDIPEKDRKEIEEILRNKDIAPTPPAIAEVYYNSQLKGRLTGVPEVQLPDLEEPSLEELNHDR